MTEKKIIAVVGATGSQGGSLVRAVLDDPDGPFVARALTRNPDSAKAAELAARGAEVVRADLNDEASMTAAFDGAYGAFVVTDSNELHLRQEAGDGSAARLELGQARNAARAAKVTGLRHVVWSTLEDTRPHFRHLESEAPDVDGDYKVPHFDAKGEANAYFLSLGVPTTFLETTFFYEVFAGFRKPRRDADGRLVLSLPMGDGVMAMVSVEDIGRTAYGILVGGAPFIGRTVGLAGIHASGEQLAEIFTRVLGEKVVYRPIFYQQVRASGQPRAEETANMYQFYTEASEAFLANRDPDRVRAINPRLRSLEDWLTEHRDEVLSDS